MDRRIQQKGLLSIVFASLHLDMRHKYIRKRWKEKYKGFGSLLSYSCLYNVVEEERWFQMCTFQLLGRVKTIILILDVSHESKMPWKKKQKTKG